MVATTRKKRKGTEKELFAIYKQLGKDLNRNVFWYNRSFANEVLNLPKFQFKGFPDKAEIYKSLGETFFKILYVFTNDANKTLCIYPQGHPMEIADLYCASMKDSTRWASKSDKANDPRKVMEAFMRPNPDREKILKIAPDISAINVFTSMDENHLQMMEIAIEKMNFAVDQCKERSKEKTREYLRKWMRRRRGGL